MLLVWCTIAWLQLFIGLVAWYPEKKLSFEVKHAMVLPLRIDTSTSSQISVLKLVPLTWMKPAGNMYILCLIRLCRHGLNFYAWYISKVFAAWLQKQDYVNWLWITLLHTCCLVCACVFQFVRPCKTVNVAPGYPALVCVKGLSNWFCPSVCLYVCQFVSLSVCQSGEKF